MGKYFHEFQMPRNQRIPDSRGPDSTGYTVLRLQKIRPQNPILIFFINGVQGNDSLTKASILGGKGGGGNRLP